MFKVISRKEYEKMIGNKRSGKENCPFCKKKIEKDAIIRQGKYWKIIYALASYSGDNRHLLAIPHKHIIFSYKLTKEHFKELKQVHIEVKNFFKNQNYFSFTRETINNCRSVEHFHIHFLVGQIEETYISKMLKEQGYPHKKT